MDVFYTNKAAKQFSKLTLPIQKRIAEKMRFYAKQNDSLKSAKHLTDFREGEYCFRVGDYRLPFDIINNKIYILKVKKRDQVYK